MISYIKQGDCLELMKEIPNNSVDLILTDPPYGVNMNGFNDDEDYVESSLRFWVNEMYRLLKPGGHCYVYIPTLKAGIFLSTFSEYFRLNNVLATRAYNSNRYAKNNFKFDNQLILYLSKGKPKNFNEVDFQKTSESWYRDKRNKNPKEYSYQYSAFMSRFSNDKSTSNSCVKNGRHPCQKSIDFEQILIQISSNEGDIVLDPFLGSGTTAIVAINTNRKYIGFELDEAYFFTAKQRIEEAEKAKSD